MRSFLRKSYLPVSGTPVFGIGRFTAHCMAPSFATLIPYTLTMGPGSRWRAFRWLQLQVTMLDSGEWR